MNQIEQTQSVQYLFQLRCPVKYFLSARKDAAAARKVRKSGSWAGARCRPGRGSAPRRRGGCARLSSGGAWHRFWQGDDRFHLDGRTQGQGSHLDRAPRRPGFPEILAVHPVDALEGAEIDEEHGHLDGIGEPAAGRCSNGRQVLEHLVAFCLDAARDLLDGYRAQIAAETAPTPAP